MNKCVAGVCMHAQKSLTYPQCTEDVVKLTLHTCVVFPHRVLCVCVSVSAQRSTS